MTTLALSHLKDDCLRHGYGRKRWWAKELGVSSLTISHWLAGRQRPNGIHALHIQENKYRLEARQYAKEAVALLFDLYYQKNDRYPPGVLSMMLAHVLSHDTFSSRELGFLSYLVERDAVSFSAHADPVLSNRLGWLLEMSNQVPSFTVQKNKRCAAHSRFGRDFIFITGYDGLSACRTNAAREKMENL